MRIAWLVGAATAILLVAAGRDPASNWEKLEQASASELARIIFGPEADAWTEKRTTRIPGVAEWQGLNVELATAPRPTDWAGLCTVETGSGYLRNKADRLILERRDRGMRYLLASGAPTLVRSSVTTPCPLRALGAGKPHDITITVGERAALPAEATFAIRSIIAAQRRGSAVRCRSYDKALCRSVALERLDLTAMYRLTITPCDGARRWCLDAQWDRRENDGPIRVAVATDTTIDAPLDVARPAIRSIALTTELWPVG